MCRYLYKTGQSLEYNPDFVARAGDLVLARASDGYWYRAVVADSDNLLAVTVTGADGARHDVDADGHAAFTIAVAAILPEPSTASAPSIGLPSR